MFVKDKSFYKTLIFIALPIALQNLLSNGLNLADSIMVSRVSETAVSSVSLAGQPNFILNLVFFGIGSGAAVLTSQYFGQGGKNDIKAINKILGMAVRFSVIISFVFFIIAEFFPLQIMLLFSKDLTIANEGVVYLQIVAFSYVVSAVTATYMIIVRSVEKVMVALIVSSSALFIDTILSYILIYGKLGFPKMGIAGAALGTLIAKFIEFILMLIHAKFFNKTLAFKFKYIFSYDSFIFKKFLSYSLPVVLNETFWGVGISFQAAIMGNLNGDAIAAYSIVSLVLNFCLVFLVGLGNASAVIIGKIIGSGNEDFARKAAKTFTFLSILVGVVTGILVISSIPFINYLYPLSDTARTYLNTILIIAATYSIIISFNVVNVIGIFRGGGDTKFSLILDIASLWICSIVFGVIGAHILKFSVPIVYIILKSDEIVKLFLGIYRMKSGKWLKNLIQQDVIS